MTTRPARRSPLLGRIVAASLLAVACSHAPGGPSPHPHGDMNAFPPVDLAGAPLATTDLAGQPPPPDLATANCVAQLNKYDFSAVDSALKQAAPGQAPGITVGAYTTTCGTIYLGAQGNLTTDAAVPLASASKLPSATAIMTLVHAGQLSLDDRVSKYLDFWPTDKAAVTIRMLLSHMSGLPGMSQCMNNGSTTLDACAREISALTLVGTPGTVFVYGGADYQVAGRIAELVSGKAWNDFFEGALTAPCGMSSLSFRAGSSTLGSDTNPRIAGGAISSNADYGKLLLLHLAGGSCNGHQLLGSADVSAMQQDELSFFAAQTGAAVTIKSSPYTDGRHYGLSWWLEPGGSVYSDLGLYGALPWISVARHYGAFVLIRKSTQVGIALMKQIEPLFDLQIDQHGI